MKASETRRKAREFLKTLSGKYQLFIVPIILAILAVSISYKETYTYNGTEFSITESVPGIISILLTLFLASASYAVLDVMRHKADHVEVGDNMRVFSNELFGKYVITAIVKWVYIFLWSLLAFVGMILLIAGATAASSNDSNVGLFLALLGFVLMIAGFVLSIIKQYSYAMTTFVLYDAVANGTYDGPNSVISKSKELMNGNKWRYFCLQFSFIGWYILTGLTCGLLHFYTLPYTTTATLYFYEDLLDKAE
ncbi:Uncharacterized membrane protein [Streptococcus equinus]|uniref:Uncharacterized membrane protein n=1 Tax=Streptococcus equinus TaxID=1335 RepID=A0A1H0ZR90_STREI|nr:DUF975 family protein [Streptococcus equinus]SDQ29948.1 Uncharacterized membrane protein [Streptococcus equinus]